MGAEDWRFTLRDVLGLVFFCGEAWPHLRMPRTPGPNLVANGGLTVIV
jgi:hypothetical protein